MKNAADSIVDGLTVLGVKTVFGYPGAAICPLYDALARRKKDISHILVRQEQNACHAANGYARISFEVGVCIATSGPGALNLIPAIACAYMDSIPIVIITGQVSSGLIGRDVFQEADITGSAEPFVKHSYLVKNAADIPFIISEAFFIAKNGRQGPVLIDIPVDVQMQKLPQSLPQSQASAEDYSKYSALHMKSSFAQRLNIPPDIEAINAACELIRAAKKPLICIGGGVFGGNCAAELCELITRFNIPAVSTMMGLSAISPKASQFQGMVGQYGNEAANAAMEFADVILFIGARVGDRAIISPKRVSCETKILHMDIDPAEINKNMNTDVALIGDAKKLIPMLIKSLDGFHCNSSFCASKEKPLHMLPPLLKSAASPERLLTSLYSLSDSDAIIVPDVGQHLLWAARYYSLENGRFLANGGMGTMGYSLGAAQGAAFAAAFAAEPSKVQPLKKRQVIAICGDGGFQMCMSELATIAREKLPIKLVILDNSSLGLVRELQDEEYNGRRFSVSLKDNPDFAKIISAYSIDCAVLDDDSKIDTALKELLSGDLPKALVCRIPEICQSRE